MGVIVVMPPARRKRPAITVDRHKALTLSAKACSLLEARLGQRERAEREAELARREAFNQSRWVRWFPFLRKSTAPEALQPSFRSGDDWSDGAFRDLLEETDLDSAQRVYDAANQALTAQVLVEPEHWEVVLRTGRHAD